MTEQKAINNVLQIFSQDQTKIVALTTFDGGSDTDEFMENYDIALKKLISIEEFEHIRENNSHYLPHAVFYRNKTPDVWQMFVENDLDHFKNDMVDRTLVVVRCFEQDEDGSFIPVHVDIPDHIKMPQVVNYEKLYEQQQEE